MKLWFSTSYYIYSDIYRWRFPALPDMLDVLTTATDIKLSAYKWCSTAAATNLVVNKRAILFQTTLATLQTADTPNPLSPIP